MSKNSKTEGQTYESKNNRYGSKLSEEELIEIEEDERAETNALLERIGINNPVGGCTVC